MRMFKILKGVDKIGGVEFFSVEWTLLGPGGRSLSVEES